MNVNDYPITVVDTNGKDIIVGTVAVSADGMTANPESAQEAGYLTINIGGTDYQIPLYGA